jgi:DNA-binding transcriptional MerR regulator
MSTATERRNETAPVRQHTIGAVCRQLQVEFPDISISKIRYLEDQGLLAPRRTRGGYRLFSEDDVERLETILRLQRDEFLPLRVIRQELSAPGPAGRGKRRKPAGLAPDEAELALDELCERAGVTRQFARDLEEYGLLTPTTATGEKRYPVGDADVALACSQLSKYGISARHLRTFRTTADREAGLLEQIVAPALSSRNAERRQAGVQDLQALAELAQELSQLLFWRGLRTFVSR